jgi:hypothetical protein
MGIKRMDKDKPRIGKILGAIRSGKMLYIHFSGSGIDPSHRSDKIRGSLKSCPGIGSQEKPETPQPKRDKIKIDINPFRGKRYLWIQRMIN